MLGSRTSPVMNLGIRSRDNDYPVTEHIPDHPPDITHHPTLLAYPVITRTSYHYLRVLNISFGWVTSASEAWRSRLTVLGAQLIMPEGLATEDPSRKSSWQYKK